MSITFSSIWDTLKTYLPPNTYGVQVIFPQIYQFITNTHPIRNGNKTLILLSSSLTLVVLIVTGRIYWYTFRIPSYLRHLPRVSVWQIIRSSINNEGILDIRKKQALLVQKDAYRRGLINSLDEFPPMWASWLLGQWIVNVSNPIDFKDLLTNQEKFEKFSFQSGIPLAWKFLGSNIASVRTPEWRHHRKIVNPAFRRGWDISIFTNPTRDLIRYLDEFTVSKSSVDISIWMRRITLDALSTAAFGMNFDALNNPDSPIFTTYQQCMKGLFDLLMTLLGRYAKILPRYRQYDKAIDKFNQLVFQLIDNKIMQLENEGYSTSSDLDHSDDKRDLLELMILAQLKQNDSFSREHLRSNCVAFIIAGHDTTANTLTFALYLLGLNQHIQEKVRKEVIEIMGDIDKDTSASAFPLPTHEQLNQLRYLTCVIKETLRVFPAVMVLQFRELLTDHTFVTTGLHVPKGTLVSGGVWNLHHSQEYWGKDADQFRPERWESLDLDMEGGIPLIPSAHNYKWVPFGGGQRICLGQQFSILEQRIILSSLLLRYTWKVVGDEHALAGCPKSESGILLNPIGIKLELSRRN